MLGTGEYTTGFVGSGASDSDKGTGVVALVMLALVAIVTKNDSDLRSV